VLDLLREHKLIHFFYFFDLRLDMREDIGDFLGMAVKIQDFAGLKLA
jgi:hypothetical protein